MNDAINIDLDDAIGEAVEAVHEIGDDIKRFTLAESADFYEAVARDATDAARAIRDEMRQGQSGGQSL